MFTGIIKATVQVKEVRDAGEGVRISVTRPDSLEEISEGESISLSGACLTVESFDQDSISFFLSEETLEKTWFSELEEGDLLNLETSLTPEEKMGGHIVQGHVDTKAEILDIDELEKGWNFTFGKPEELENLLVEKGFVAVEGISLTVAEITEDSFSVTIIPETWNRTNLSEKEEGDPVNLEPDMMAKYVQKHLENMD